MEVYIENANFDIIEQVKKQDAFFDGRLESARQNTDEREKEIAQLKRSLSLPNLTKRPEDLTRSEISALEMFYLGNQLKVDDHGLRKKLKDPTTKLETIQELQEFAIEKITGHIKHLENVFGFIEESKNTVELNIAVEVLDSDQAKEKLFKALIEMKNAGKKVQVSMVDSLARHKNSDKIEFLYDEKQSNRFVELNNFLVENGMGPLNFKPIRSSKNSWTLETVIQANETVDTVVAFIKEKNFTPFEAMLYIHRYVTAKFTYIQGGSDYEGRILPSIVGDGKIVCTGYATLVKAIVDKLDMPGLEVDLVGCSFFKEKKGKPVFTSGHCHNLVRIKDDKYDIDGCYMEDACWDSRDADHKRGRGFAHCLYPVEDLKHFADGSIYIDDKTESRYSKAIIHPEYSVARSIVNMVKVMNSKELVDKAFSMYDRTDEKELKGGSKIYDEYHEQSKPIKFETFSRGIHSMIEKFGGVEEVKVTNIQTDMLADTLEAHEESFGPDSVSEFNQRKEVQIEHPTAPRI